MAGLLDFVAGFGVGALGGVAEQKKANLEQKRQLNLAKLKAEYASDIETKKEERAIKQRTEIANLQQTDPAAAQEQAFIAGVKLPSAPTDTRTSTQKNVEAAAEARGLKPGTPEYSNFVADAIERSIGTPVTNINFAQQSEEVFRTELAKQDVERLGEVETRAVRALDQRSELDRLDAAIVSGQFTTGSASGFRYGVGQYATLFGMDPSEIPLIGNPVTADTIESTTELIAANLVGDITQNAAMRGSTALLEMARNSGPKLSRTPEGNAILVEVLKRKGEREIEVASLAQDYAREGGFRPEGKPSFMEAVIKLNRDDPIVTPELQERIKTATDAAPSAKDMAEQIGEGYPRVNFAADASSGLTLEQINARLDALGVKPGEKFIDSEGRRATRPLGE